MTRRIGKRESASPISGELTIPETIMATGGSAASALPMPNSSEKGSKKTGKLWNSVPPATNCSRKARATSIQP